jgi:multiple sugar transport system permease protein
MKRALFKIFSIVVLLSLILGNTVSGAEKTITLEVWGIPKDPGKLKALEDFQKENPSIKLNIVLGAFGFQERPEKLLTAIASGNPPDVVLIDRMTVAEWAGRGALRPLDDVAEEYGIKASDYQPEVWRGSVFNGHLYATPSHFNITCSLFWNRRMYKEAGLKPNTPPRTWDQMLDYIKKLTKKDDRGNIIQAGFGFGYYALLYVLGWQMKSDWIADEKHATINRPENIQALEFIKKMYDAQGGRELYDKFASGVALPPNLDLFTFEKVAMIRGASYNHIYYTVWAPKLDYGAAPFPIPKGGKYANIIGGRGWTIPNGIKGEKLEAAKKLVAWMALKGGLSVWKGATHYPARLDDLRKLQAGDPKLWEIPSIVPEGAAYKTIPSIVLTKLKVQLKEAIEYARQRPVMPVSAYMYDQLTRAWEDVTYGRMSTKDALDRAQRDVQKALDEFWARYK